MNDDRVFAFGLVGNDLGFCSDVNTASTCAVSLNNASAPGYDGARWEVWSWDVSDQVIDF